jgi:hypothetical protein
MLKRLLYLPKKLLKVNSKNIVGYYQTVQKSSSEIEKEQKVDVYEGPEWQEIQNSLTKNNYFNISPNSNENIKKLQDMWEDCVFSTSFKPKYFSLLPFNLEDRQSLYAKKKFVLKMELYPDTKYLRFTYAMISGNALLKLRTAIKY